MSSYVIWLVVYLPLWKMMDFVSWDDDSIPNQMESQSKFHGSSHHQPVISSYAIFILFQQKLLGLKPPVLGALLSIFARPPGTCPGPRRCNPHRPPERRKSLRTLSSAFPNPYCWKIWVIMVILIGNSFFFDFHGYFHGDIIHDIWENWLIIVVCIYIYYWCSD